MRGVFEFGKIVIYLIQIYIFISFNNHTSTAMQKLLQRGTLGYGYRVAKPKVQTQNIKNL